MRNLYNVVSFGDLLSFARKVGFHWNGKKLKVLVDGKVYQKVLFERKAREYMNG